jgi:hypothetical protein
VSSQGVESHGFLGEEFLTWLWFRQETDRGEHRLAGGRVVGVMLDDLLMFAAPGGEATEQTLRRGSPTRTVEARSALRQGHRLARARVLIAEGDHQWAATFHGATFTMSGVKLPADSEEAGSEQERSEERAGNWLALHELVLALYREFLRVRLDPGYLKSEAETQANWMAQ